MSDTNLYLTGDEKTDTRRITYIIFISAVAVLSFAVSLAFYLLADPEASQVLYILDFLYALIFLYDFFQRLRHASDRRYYMLRWGWLDFLTSIPGIPALRIVRSLSVIIRSRRILSAAPDEIEHTARSRMAESVLFVTVYIGLIVLTLGSVFIVYAEADAPGAVITSGYDAVWWSLVTVSTVGYGDEYPVTIAGRIIGVLMIIVGVALFTTLTSYLASNFTDRGARQQREQQLEVARENTRNLEKMLDRILSLEEEIAGRSGNETGDEEEGN